MRADQEYACLLQTLAEYGQASSPRGKRTIELLQHTTMVDMEKPIVTTKARKLSYKFMASEALWILTGSNRLDFNEHIERNWARFSDDGITLAGAYGPPFVEQYRYVAEKLREDRDTRQAVMTLWRSAPRASRDVPCTVALQFLIRGKYLSLNVFMRSSDAWLGWPYDVFTFSMMAQFIRLCVQPVLGPLQVGVLRLTAGSQHLYDEHIEASKAVINSDHGDYQAISMSRSSHPGEVLAYLRHAIDEPGRLFQ